MAQRRMFSLKVVDTDAFLDMPPSSQLLYFHLAMRADDDGFIANPKKIMRFVGSPEDDLKILFTKRFVIPFESGVCVIKHWKIHNYIQSDRYMPTQWTKEMKMLEVDKETQKYRLKQGQNEVSEDNVSKVDTQVRDRLELGKDRIEIIAPEGADKTIPEIIFLFKDVGVNPLVQKLYGNKSQRGAVERMLKEFGREKLEEMIRALPIINARPYWPKSTTPCQLEDNIPKYKAKNDEEKNKSQKNKFVEI